MALPKQELTKIYGLLAEVPEYETKPEFMNKKFDELLQNDKYLDEQVIVQNQRMDDLEDQLLTRPTQEVLDEEVAVLELKIGTKVNSSTFTAAKTALEAKNTEQDNAITEKVKLNSTSTDVNFKAEGGKLTSVQLGGETYNFPTSEYAFSIDEDGMLVVTYRDNTNPPDFSIDEDGCLTLTI